MLVLGHLLQLHRIFLSICLTFQKQETSPDIRIPVRSEGVCHQDVVKLTSLPPFLTMEMPNVFWHFRTFKTSQINLGNLWLPAPSGHNPSQGDLSHYLPADTEWVSLGMAVSYSSHYLQPGWLCWKDSLLCYSQGEVYRNQINTFLFCLLPSSVFWPFLGFVPCQKDLEWQNSGLCCERHIILNHSTPKINLHPLWVSVESVPQTVLQTAQAVKSDTIWWPSSYLYAFLNYFQNLVFL